MKHTESPETPNTHRYPLDEVPEHGSRGISIIHAGLELKLLLVRQNNQIFCYRNQCPHMGVNLDWLEHQFLDSSGELIQCATHGALFRIEDGECISGPCHGQKLVPVRVESGEDFFVLQP